MKKMQETIEILRKEADLNQGCVALNADHTKKLIELLELCDKLINEQGHFIEQMKADLFKSQPRGPREKSW